MNRNRLALIAVVAVVAVAGLAAAGWLLRPMLFPSRLPEGILEGYGRIEGTEVTVGSKVAGRVMQLAVREGDRVRMGDLVAVLSKDEIEDRLAQAKAHAGAAEAQLKMREEDSQARLAEANARLAAAEERLKQAQARNQVLEHHARTARDNNRRDRDLFAKGFISERQVSVSDNALTQAEGEITGANRLLAASRADAEAARAARDGIARQAPPLLESLAEEATAAHAAHEEAGVALADTRITAPADGTVITKAVEAGELVAPGRALVVLADLERPWLRVYLPERDIGKVKLGDAARVYVDSFPQRPFEAMVTEVANKAEFTPKDVHMADERVTLVYAVKLEIKSPEGLLKPGMPGDALIRWKPDVPWSRP